MRYSAIVFSIQGASKKFTDGKGLLMQKASRHFVFCKAKFFTSGGLLSKATFKMPCA